MKKVLLVVCLIIGTVIGSGFSSGKEIAVFFSRFGYVSFITIPICFVLFYFGFYLLMSKGQSRLQKTGATKGAMLGILICAIIFSSSMFAGVTACCQGVTVWLTAFLYLCTLVLCIFACFKKIEFLSKFNLIFVPLLLFIILAFFIYNFEVTSIDFNTANNFATVCGGGIFGVLYFVLNLSMPSVVIAGCGEGLTKKQIKLASFLSAFILSVFTLIINLLIICNYEFVLADMPLLSLSNGLWSPLLRFVILLGCLTTLLSEVYICSTSCKGLGIGDKWLLPLCIGVPLLMSIVGFSGIISWLYPLASLMGVVLLFLIFFRKV